MYLNFHNKYHLGDCIFTIIYINKLCRYDKRIKVKFYCNRDYHNQLYELIECKEKVSLFEFKEIGESTWINRDNLYHGDKLFKGKYAQYYYYDNIYIDFNNYLSNKINIDLKFINNKEILFDSFIENEELYSYKFDYDILIVNSTPHSKQFSYCEEEFNCLIRVIAKKFKVITTKKVEGIECTIDSGYSILEIGKLSCFIRIFICIHTAPHILTINNINIDKIENWYCLHNRHSINFDFVKHSRDLSELRKILMKDLLI